MQLIVTVKFRNTRGDECTLEFDRKSDSDNPVDNCIAIDETAQYLKSVILGVEPE